MNEIEQGQKLDNQEIECAKNYRDIAHAGMLSAEKRGSELADEFTRLEVQIAGILIAFVAGILFNFFDERIKNLTGGLVLGMKFIYTLSVICLILSLVLGLIHIKRKQIFWKEMMNQRLIRLKKWIAASKGDGTVTFKEAKAFQAGTSLEKGNIVSTPEWIWISQTIFLGFAVVLFFVLFLIFLFK